MDIPSKPAFTALIRAFTIIEGGTRRSRLPTRVNRPTGAPENHVHSLHRILSRRYVRIGSRRSGGPLLNAPVAFIVDMGTSRGSVARFCAMDRVLRSTVPAGGRRHDLTRVCPSAARTRWSERRTARREELLPRRNQRKHADTLVPRRNVGKGSQLSPRKGGASSSVSVRETRFGSSTCAVGGT